MADRMKRPFIGLVHHHRKISTAQRAMRGLIFVSGVARAPSGLCILVITWGDRSADHAFSSTQWNDKHVVSSPSTQQDCDGVILEASDAQRQACNAAFKHFNVRTGGRTIFVLCL